MRTAIRILIRDHEHLDQADAGVQNLRAALQDFQSATDLIGLADPSAQDVDDAIHVILNDHHHLPVADHAVQELLRALEVVAASRMSGRGRYRTGRWRGNGSLSASGMTGAGAGRRGPRLPPPPPGYTRAAIEPAPPRPGYIRPPLGYVRPPPGYYIRDPAATGSQSRRHRPRLRVPERRSTSHNRSARFDSAAPRPQSPASSRAGSSRSASHSIRRPLAERARRPAARSPSPSLISSTESQGSRLGINEWNPGGEPDPYDLSKKYCFIKELQLRVNGNIIDQFQGGHDKYEVIGLRKKVRCKAIVTVSF